MEFYIFMRRLGGIKFAAPSLIGRFQLFRVGAEDGISLGLARKVRHFLN